MKLKSAKPPKSDFTKGIERALRRAAKQARVEAKRYGTPIWIQEGDKLIALQP